MIKATVSGSFHRHMSAIAEAVANLRALGVEVLSPSDPTVVAADGDFLFVASDRLRSRKMVEDRHLEAIRHSDFLWVVCPDGYTGASTSGEILAAAVLHKPIFSTTAALDITIGDYVESVSSMGEVISRVRSCRSAVANPAHVLLNPEMLSNTASEIDTLRQYLTGVVGDRRAEPERRFALMRNKLGYQFGLNELN
jgi:hypothetical protein